MFMSIFKKIIMAVVSIATLPLLVVDLVTLVYGRKDRKQLDSRIRAAIEDMERRDTTPGLTGGQVGVFIRVCLCRHAEALRKRGFRVVVINDEVEGAEWVASLPIQARNAVASVAGFAAMALTGQANNWVTTIVLGLSAWVNNVDRCPQVLFGTDIIIDAPLIEQAVLSGGKTEFSEKSVAWSVAHIVGHEIRHTQDPLGWYAALQYINATALMRIFMSKGMAARGVNVYQASIVERDADLAGVVYADEWIRTHG